MASAHFFGINPCNRLQRVRRATQQILWTYLLHRSSLIGSDLQHESCQLRRQPVTVSCPPRILRR